MALVSNTREFEMHDLQLAFLTCPVCMDATGAGQQLELKMLECQHTVCKTCLVQLIDRQSCFNCPVCRRTIRVPDQGADGITKNLIAQQIWDFANSCKTKKDLADAVTEERVKCGGCKGEIDKVLDKCLNCGYLCSTCTWQHRDSKDLRHHTILDRGSQPGKPTSTRFCSKHNMCRLDFYCRTCQVALCKFCIHVEHAHAGPRHSVQDVHDEAQETSKEMNSLLDAVIDRRSLVFEGFCKVRRKEEYISTESSTAKEKLKAFIQECHNVLNRREKELIGSIDHRSKQASKCLKYSKERATDLLIKIRRSMEYADQIKKEPDPLSVIRAAAALKPALLEIANAPLDFDAGHDNSSYSVTDNDLQFDITAFERLVSSLGKKSNSFPAEDVGEQ